MKKLSLIELMNVEGGSAANQLNEFSRLVAKDPDNIARLAGEYVPKYRLGKSPTTGKVTMFIRKNGKWVEQVK